MALVLRGHVTIFGRTIRSAHSGAGLQNDCSLKRETSMLSRNIKKWLAVAALLGCSLAMAQSEPTLNQVYEAANAGKLEQAQVMMQQVLVAHPDSGKAHFVQAELSARQGNLSRAREELALAEKLAPGLPFAKSGAVQSLRSQLAAKGSTESMNKATTGSPTPPRSAAPEPAASSFPWGMALALGAGAIALVVFLTRKKAQAPAQPQAYAQAASAANAQGSGLSGPQTFGTASGATPASGQPGYGQPAYGQPAGSGLGGKVMGGLATGLAVGAGVMAAQAIGKNLMGGNSNENPAHPQAAADNGIPLAGNSDLGGQNFGVSDAGSWDDAGIDVAGGMDGGGDWDS
jgi:uncharacterized protein